MRLVVPSSFLRRALVADAIASAAVAAAQVAAAEPLQALLGLPLALLVESGWFLVAYVVMLFAMAAARRVPAALVTLVVVGNVGWAIGCVTLAALHGPTALGIAWLVAQATVVLVFAALERRGLERSPPASHGVVHA